MSMDFSGSAGAASSFDTIPQGQLAFCVLTVRGVKKSNSGGEYIDCELVVDQGQPYAGRKFWEMIGNPFHQGNSEKYRQMGQIAITRILEAGKGAGPNNPGGYKLNDFSELTGLRVPVKIGVEEGEDGHDDKNRVAEWLTPNPASKSGHKWMEKLLQGVFNVAAAKAPDTQPNGFGGNNGSQQTTGGFGNGGSAAPGAGAASVASPGFGNGSGFQTPPAGDSSGQSGAGAISADKPSQQTGATVAPSDPGATPGWLAQAGEQAQG